MIEINTIMFIIYFILIMLFVFLAIELKDLVKSTISLAIASLILSILFYQYGAHIAAMFELSVGVGLITVLMISAISMTKSVEDRK
jgi:uncharacterized MnhB-related membrane protein